MTKKLQNKIRIQPKRMSGVAAMSLLLVVVSIATLGVRELLPSHAATGTTFLQGAYVGSLQPANSAPYEAFLGHKLDLTTIFMDGSPNPLGGTPPYFTFNAEQQKDWAGKRLLVAPGAPFGIVVNPYSGQGPACGNQSQQDTFWSKMAAGTYDSYVKTQAQNLVSTGHADSVIRVMHEYNGNWYPYCLYNSPTQIANFKKTFQNWVNIYRSTPGQKFSIMWNPTYNPNNLGSQAVVTSSYPGDAYVDYVGIDVYDDYMSGYAGNTYNQTDAVRQAAFNNLLTRGDFGLNVWASFAKSHGKPLAFPEWGLGYDGQNSGGDNPYYVDGMAAFFKNPANNVGIESFWEENDTGHDPKGVWPADNAAGRAFAVPRARAAFLAQFGGAANAGPGSGTGGVSNPPVVTKVTTPLRIYAGNDYTDPSGNAWVSDAAYTTDGSTDTQGAGKITGTTNTALYENERWNNPHIGYAIPIANGTYTVNLHFAEISPNVTAPGKRVFSGTAEGKALFSNLDIYNEVGAYKPDDKSYQVTVTDGELDVSLDSTVDAAKLSGLEILPAQVTPPPPPPSTLIGDINGDGHINTLDLSILLSHDGQNYTPADLNKDGTIGAADLAIMLSNWTW
jgi:hypothetical protein